MHSSGAARMGEMPVGRLLMSMSVPIMISMLIQALYNIVDSIFVARLGEEALAAVSLAFPVQMLVISVGVGTAVGLNSLVSRRLGEGRREEAATAAATGVFLAVLSWAAFAILGFFLSGSFFSAFTSHEGILLMGEEYLSICLIFSLGIFGYLIFERIMQATGSTVYPMIVQISGAVVNIILDPILIFGLVGFPAMGVRGAAIATVIGQSVSMVLCILFNAKTNRDIRFSRENFRFSAKSAAEIYKVGLPAIIMQAIGSLLTVGLNKILIVFSASAVSVLGIFFRLQSFVFMPIFGLVNGMSPIVGYNFGARNRNRIVRVIQIALFAASAVMLAGTALFQLFPRQFLSLFNPSKEMLVIGVPALRIASSCFVFAGVSI
ncbi:MAG: MATE family efflux transporter, partial [Spirochaetaceae bacterium]|nr:MATE family efflux transporter [Spirochaetaceae bacterium]